MRNPLTQRVAMWSCLACSLIVLLVFAKLAWAQVGNQSSSSDVTAANEVMSQKQDSDLTTVSAAGADELVALPTFRNETIQVDELAALRSAEVNELLYLTPTIPSADETQSKATAVLGVHVRTADDTLREHLRLPAGVGLVIEHVAEDSAAEVAGIQTHDVFYRLEEQLLVNEQQLSTLIKMHRPGDSIDLTIVRSGKQQKVSATLKEGQSAAATLLLNDVVKSAHADWTDLAKVHGMHATDIQDCKACHQVSSHYLQKIPLLNHFFMQMSR